MTGRKSWSPERRDVIWIESGPQAGIEAKGMHALLVLSPRAFNERTGMVIGLPMTSAAISETNPFAVKVSGARGVEGYILTHQPGSFNWKTRHAKAHPMKQVPEEIFSLACESLNQIIAICD